MRYTHFTHLHAHNSANVWVKTTEQHLFDISAQFVRDGVANRRKGARPIRTACPGHPPLDERPLQHPGVLPQGRDGVGEHDDLVPRPLMVLDQRLRAPELDGAQGSGGWCWARSTDILDPAYYWGNLQHNPQIDVDMYRPPGKCRMTGQYQCKYSRFCRIPGTLTILGRKPDGFSGNMLKAPVRPYVGGKHNTHMIRNTAVIRPLHTATSGQEHSRGSAQGS